MPAPQQQERKYFLKFVPPLATQAQNFLMVMHFCPACWEKTYLFFKQPFIQSIITLNTSAF